MIQNISTIHKCLLISYRTIWYWRNSSIYKNDFYSQWLALDTLHCSCRYDGASQKILFTKIIHYLNWKWKETINQNITETNECFIKIIDFTTTNISSISFRLLNSRFSYVCVSLCVILLKYLWQLIFDEHLSDIPFPLKNLAA